MHHTYVHTYVSTCIRTYVHVYVGIAGVGVLSDPCIPAHCVCLFRLSKELSRESLKMDMRNEKKTLENAPNNIAEETEPSSSPNLLVEDKNLAELIEGTENAKDKVTEKEPSLKGTPGKEPGGQVSFVMKVGSNNVAKESGPTPAKESSEETPLEDNLGGRKEESKTDEAAVPNEKEQEQQREKVRTLDHMYS